MAAEPVTTTSGPEDVVRHPDRHVGLEGAVNFRDLGGYPAADGRHVRWRTLFRADGLSSLTERDRGIIRELGVATVIDLRTTVEYEAGRFPVDEIPVGYHHLPFLDELPDPETFKMTPGILATQYQEIARDAAPQIGRVLSIVASRETHPVIVHCTAGKDRTGVLVAVLLALLGVHDEVIVADYMLSAEAMSQLRTKLIARYPEGREMIEQADEMFSLAPANIEQLLAVLRDRHGSIEAYAAAAGAGPDVVAGLRRHLLD
ncbi:MAG TPA: tyrosine-protein phosphatase [Acidimicrobiales bacterium]|nr:tyrosine-protein phosphatase [Acidimicrobiales bacterium]